MRALLEGELTEPQLKALELLSRGRSAWEIVREMGIPIDDARDLLRGAEEAILAAQRACDV